MGLFDFFLKNNKKSENVKCPAGYKVVGRSENGAPIFGEIEPKLHAIDKELIMVNRVTEKDMAQFEMMPFQLNCPVKKFIRDGGHPFAYIDLNKTNQVAAKLEIEKVNEYIVQARDYIPLLSKDIEIKIEKIMLYEYDKNYGYSRIICTPHTISGKISKYPLHLLFMSRVDIRSYFVTGKLFYEKDGSIGKADVSIIKNGTQWTFEFKTIGKTFLLNKVKSSIKPDDHGMPSVIYQAQI